MSQENSANLTYNITGNGLTTIPGRWILEAVVINTKGASSNIAEIYDDIEGEETAENLKATIDTTDGSVRLNYGIPMFKGINVRVKTGTAADITLIYKVMS